MALALVLPSLQLVGCASSVEPAEAEGDAALLPNPWRGEPLAPLEPSEAGRVLAEYLESRGYETSTVAGDRVAVLRDGLLVAEVQVFGSGEEGTRNVVYRVFTADDPSERVESFERRADKAGVFETFREVVFAITHPA